MDENCLAKMIMAREDEICHAWGMDVERMRKKRDEALEVGVTYKRRAEELEAAAKKLLRKMQKAFDHADYMAVWSCALVHGQQYRGPIFENEIKALHYTLDLVTGEEERDEPCYCTPKVPHMVSDHEPYEEE